MGRRAVHCVFCYGKWLIQGDFLERGEAQDLHDCVQADLEPEAVLEEASGH